MQPTQQVANGHVQERNLLDQIAEESAREQAKVGQRYMPTLTPQQFVEREKLLRDLKDMLVDGIDYGVIPGTNDKPVLLLPGAQKIGSYFGYVPHYEVRQIEDWTGAATGGEPLFYYDYTCVLYRGVDAVGEGRGSCNSWESKYRYRWVRQDQLTHLADEEFEKLPSRGGKAFEFGFAIDKAETTGKYGKPAEYWEAFKKAITEGTAVKMDRETKRGMMSGWEIDQAVYRIHNENFADNINTCQKIGQKRAYIAAVLSATGASQYFTQDLEDMDHGIDTGAHPKGTQAAADHVAQRKISDAKGSGPQAQACSPPGSASASEGRGESATTAPTSDPEFEKLAAESQQSLGSYNKVCSGLLDIIGGEYGPEARSKVWADAVASVGRRSGDAARRDVLLFIYKAASVIEAPKQEVA